MSSGFVTESEIAETRKKRQEEWDRVRQPDDPLERPEKPYDSRSLFDRLQEQKQKKELEYEEAHKLKNMIKGLDDDEIDFLDLVDRKKIEADRKKDLEEERELNDFRNRVATLQEKTLEEKLQAEKVPSKPKPNNKMCQQQKLLKGVVICKSNGVKRKEPGSEEDSSSPNKIQKIGDTVENETDALPVPANHLKCVAILPGLGSYSESSDEYSSDSEIEHTTAAPIKMDLCGRRIEKVDKKERDS